VMIMIHEKIAGEKEIIDKMNAQMPDPARVCYRGGPRRPWSRGRPRYTCVISET
jgi:hypothetical protein